MRQQGFSLIEVLIAIAVAATVLPAVVILLSFGSFTSLQGEVYTKAYAIAQKEMESIYSLKTSWGDWSPTSPVDSTVITTEDVFVKTVKIERCVSGGTVCTNGFNNNVSRKITVKVSWSEKGSNQDMTIESYVAKI